MSEKRIIECKQKEIFLMRKVIKEDITSAFLIYLSNDDVSTNCLELSITSTVCIRNLDLALVKDVR